MTRLLRAAVVGLLLAGALLAAGGWFLRQPTRGSEPFRGRLRADPQRLESHVRTLTTDLLPRDADHPESLERTAAYVDRHFRATGARVDSRWYDVRRARYRNVMASFGPETGPRLVVGAHYDAFSLFEVLPGADDNASGTAGLLELARLLAGAEVRQRVDLVAYTLEEPPYFASPHMGSRVHADDLATEGVEVTGMICLEMIGFFSERQEWPSALLGLYYPRRGDFIGVVGRPADRSFTRSVKRAMRGAGDLPVYSFNGPAMMGTDASDHRNYWRQGWTAVMVTDTAFVRNGNYHTAGDTADTLDYRRMAAVVDGVQNAVLTLAGEPAGGDR
jgi:hypothetical protein